MRYSHPESLGSRLWQIYGNIIVDEKRFLAYSLEKQTLKFIVLEEKTTFILSDNTIAVLNSENDAWKIN